MIFEAPKPLTATVHVRFHYRDLGEGTVSQGETERIGRILDQAGEMAPELLEMLLKFASFVSDLRPKEDGQSSS